MHDRSPVHLLLPAALATIALGAVGGTALWRMMELSDALTALTPEADAPPPSAERPYARITRAPGQTSAAPATPKAATPSTAPETATAHTTSVGTVGATPRSRSLFMGVPQCQSAPRVLASVVDVKHPERSFAAIRLGAGTYFVREGEQIAGIELVKLRPARAYLQRPGGPLCVTSVFSGERAPQAAPRVAKAKPPSKPAPRAKQAKPALFSDAELKAGIRPLGPDRYAVSRELLERAFQNVAALRTSAAFRVKSGGGRVMGLEVSRMRKNSVLKHLGLQRGDVVSKLNGHDLTDPGEALQAMTAIKTAERFTLSTLRGGAQRSIEYVVQ